MAATLPSGPAFGSGLSSVGAMLVGGRCWGHHRRARVDGWFGVRRARRRCGRRTRSPRPTRRRRGTRSRRAPRPRAFVVDLLPFSALSGPQSPPAAVPGRLVGSGAARLVRRSPPTLWPLRSINRSFSRPRPSERRRARPVEGGAAVVGGPAGTGQVEQVVPGAASGRAPEDSEVSLRLFRAPRPSKVYWGCRRWLGAWSRPHVDIPVGRRGAVGNTGRRVLRPCGPPPPSGSRPRRPPVRRGDHRRRHGARRPPVVRPLQPGVPPHVRRVAAPVPADPPAWSGRRRCCARRTGRSRASASRSASRARRRSRRASARTSAGPRPRTGPTFKPAAAHGRRPDVRDPRLRATAIPHDSRRRQRPPINTFDHEARTPSRSDSQEEP